MNETQLLCAAICIMPFITVLACVYACALRIQHREGDTRRFRRPGTEPFRPDSKLKPFKKSPDMCVEDE